MPCVSIKIINNKRGTSEYKLKSYAIDNVFTIDMERWNRFEHTQKLVMELSVSEANVLKEQLEQFIRMNQMR